MALGRAGPRRGEGVELTAVPPKMNVGGLLGGKHRQ